MRRGVVACVLIAGAITTACGSDDAASDSGGDDPLAAAEAICPLMWQWVKDVGETFNDASAGVADIDDGAGRRERWMAALDEMEALNAELADDVDGLPHGVVIDPLADQIERDLPRSDAEIDDIRSLFDEYPEIDEQRHQARTMQVIVRVEKVIDLPKPDLAALDTDGSVIDAFRQVPSCQHSMRDVDDGTTQSND